MNSLIKITLIKRTRNLFHSASNQNHLNEKGLESLIHFISQMIKWGNDQEIEVHAIEIGVFHEIESFCKILHNCSGDQKGLGGHYFRVFFSDLT